MSIRTYSFLKTFGLRSFLRLGGLFFIFFLTPIPVFSADDPAPKTNKISLNFYQQGRDFVSQGKWSNAIKSFKKAIQQDKQDHKAFNLLGYSLRQSGKIPQAIIAYSQSLKLNPNYEEALEYRAIAFARIGKKEKAMQDYNKLLSLKSSLSDGLKEKIIRYLSK